MNNCKKTSIGGQALIEGVMMRGPIKTAMSVRLPSGEIETELWDTYPNGKPPVYSKWPFVRGIFNMVDNLRLGFKCLMSSADKAGMEDEEPSRFEKWLSRTFKAELSTVISTLGVILGVGLAVLLFIVLPTAVASIFKPYITGNFAYTLVEGAVKVVVFLLYLWLCCRSSDVARLFAYHGAEHKTIACYEAGEELIPENCRDKTRFHPRCGTSFLLIVLIVSILVSSFVPPMHPLLRMVVRLALLPVVVGVAYEFIKLCGRYTNPVTAFFSTPGLWLQRLTTKEPDDSMLEVAIAAMTAVIPPDGKSDQW